MNDDSLQTSKGQTGFLSSDIEDNAREHKSNCPMNTIGEVLQDTKQLHKELNGQIESNK